VLPTPPRKPWQGSQLAQPVNADAVDGFARWKAALPDRGDDDLVATIQQLRGEKVTLDLCSSDVRRLVVRGKQDSHYALSFVE
jgi:hypothetical protein